MATLFLLTVLAISQTRELEEQQSQRSITVYNIKGETAIGLIDGRSVTFIGSQKLWENENAMLFHVKHHWWNRGVTRETFVEMTDTICNRVLKWNEVSFSIVNRSKMNHSMKEREEHMDFAIVHAVNWQEVQSLDEIRVKKLIISNAIGPKTKERLKGVPNVNSVFVSEVGAISIE